jgi:cytochrome P450
MPLFRRGKIISNLDLIVDCVDKLLDKWRVSSAQKVHLDIIQQCQNLLLAIFGFVAYDYDLKTLDDDISSDNNDLTQALRDVLDVFQTAIHSPTFVSKIYLKLNLRYQRARATIDRYCNQIIEQELAENPELIAQRKRTSLIASLVSSLQHDEQAEAKKSEDEKKGKFILEIKNDTMSLSIVRFVSH